MARVVVLEKYCRAMFFFVDTGALPTLPVFTGRADVNMAREHW